ncbi:transcriptional regulator [Paractinoplanes deccanensis]|uniref:Transcriptional regulator n=1 Tax=Paractinoplanes deccanensis TaxID=113561 RepID=A0ABQ3YEM0_9ACTN|nr:helix-turn-helix domain-containing protein [Actinoplanes deccanensis]GID78456.1 transcriptional regulator [Actinoplanes deccanensis]
MTTDSASFGLDTRTVGASGLPRSLRAWQAWLGERSSTPDYDPATMADLRIRFQQVRVGDALLHRHEGFSPVRAAKPAGTEGMVSLILVRRGTATVELPRDSYALAAGEFAIRRLDRPASFTNGAHTAGMSITLPGHGLAPLLGDRVVRGHAGSAPTRLLTAYADLLHDAGPELDATGARAARNALIELTTAVLRDSIDLTAVHTVPALVAAARRLADRRLTDAALGPATLASELHVSARTLQRAFAATGEPLMAYIRRRRLEQARRDLTDPARAMTVAEIAARWRFSDGGHLSRAFKKQYGHTPSDYARDSAGLRPTRP